VLFELVEYGKDPYENMPPKEVIEFVTKGSRLTCSICPRLIYDLMLKCWDQQPLARPTFKEIFEILTDIQLQLFKTSK